MGAPAVSEVALEAREAAEALVAEEREATREEGRGVVDSAPLGAGEETEKWRAGRVRTTTRPFLAFSMTSHTPLQHRGDGHREGGRVDRTGGGGAGVAESFVLHVTGSSLQEI